MKLKIEVLQRLILESLGLRAAIEDDHNGFCPRLVQLHHNQSRNLAGSCVEELQIGLDFRERSHPEKIRGVAYAQQLFEPLPAACDLIGTRTDCGIGQEWLLNRPVGSVVALNWQTHSPIICLVSEIEPVEPVAGVIAVLVHRFRSQQVVAGQEEWNSLPESDQAHGQVLAPDTLIERVRKRRLQLHSIEERLIVVYRGV